jgi:hypothetical protein
MEGQSDGGVKRSEAVSVGAAGQRQHGLAAWGLSCDGVAQTAGRD